jgi:hypothetical protein
MDVLQIELAKLRKDGNLSQSIQDVDKIIEQLERAKAAIVEGMLDISSKPTRAVELTRGCKGSSGEVKTLYSRH